MRKLFDSPWFYFGLAGLLLLLAVASQLRLGPPPQPKGDVDDIATLRERDDLNVLFFVVDTLRADRLGSYGYERPTSPHIDAIAKTGVRFARVEAQSSWTKSSMASLWTGLYPQSVGILRHGDAIPEEARLPAEILKDAGFHTAGIYRNGWVAQNFGFAQGFDLYITPRVNVNPERIKRQSPNAAHPLQGTDLDLTESAIEFLQAYREQRFFLYVHYMDVHQYTYDSNSDLFGTSFSDIYDNGIHWTDSNLGQVVRGLEALGLRDKTIIVIAADHGEGFFEHGFEGHAKELYREVQHTPLILSLPFDLDPGVVVESQVANVDIWPTLLDMLGLEPLQPADGKSMLPLVMAAGRGEDESKVEEFAGRAVFSQIDRSWGKPKHESSPFIAVVKPPYRFHYKARFPNQAQLFDHTTDPLEEQNLARERPEVVEALRAEIDAYVETPPSWETLEVELDEMRLHQLRALGYAVGGQK